MASDPTPAIKQREVHVEKIIMNSLDAVEKEHGIWGLDHVVQLVEERRSAAIQELQAHRDQRE